VAQEAFVKISKSLDEFRGESQLSTWIYRIATNTALDHLRKPSSQQSARTVDIPGEDDLSADERAMFQYNAPLHDTSLIRRNMNECIRVL